MNNRSLKLRNRSSRKSKAKSIALSIVILLEIIVLFTVASYAWVETVSSVKLNNYDTVNNQSVPNTRVKSYVHTRAHFTEAANTLDLGNYFRQAGDMHLSPASSTNGETFYFPETQYLGTTPASGVTPYREGTLNDKNTLYLSVTFELTVQVYANIYFTHDPSFGTLNNDIRVAVFSTSSSSGVESTHQMFYKGVSESTTEKVESVVGNANGDSASTTSQTFYKYCSDYADREPLFAINAGETKTVTINLWLQKKSTDMASAMATAVNISNFGLTSSQVPRKITLFPTAAWPKTENGTTYYYYGWCFDNANASNPSDLIPLSDDNETGHYIGTFNGSYPSVLFFRSTRSDLTKEAMTAAVWIAGYQTDNLELPNNPVDLSYVITSKGTTGGSSGTKAGVERIVPVNVKVNYYTGQTSAGTIKAYTYTDTDRTNQMEVSSTTSGNAHLRLAHGYTGKGLKLTATENAGWKFVGWYTNSNCTTAAPGSYTNKTYTTTISASEGATANYYAKFKQVRTVNLTQYLDGVSSTTGGSINISDSTGSSTTGTNPKSRVVNKDATVTLTATPSAGYTFAGFYSVADGGTALSATENNGTYTATITAGGSSAEISYWARFTTNYYNVTAHACYSTDNGTTYTVDNSTGGMVKVGDASQGATSTKSVKYKTSVELTASPASGYEFVGWYTAATGGSPVTSPYSLSTVGNKNVYARFKINQFTITAKAYYSSNGSNYTAGSTGGTVKIGTNGTAGATASTTATVNGTAVSLVASSNNGYKFVGWYNTSGTLVHAGATYSYTLTSYSNVELRARFTKMDTVHLKGQFDWTTGYEMVGKDGVYTYTFTNVPEGGFEMKVYNDTTGKWYGLGTGDNKTKVTEVGTYSNLATETNNLVFEAHAGSYTFTYDQDNNSLAVSRNSYNDIVITFDASDQHWVADANAIIYLEISGESGILMTKNGYKWTATVRSDKSIAGFKRNNPGNTTTWNSWTDSNATSRGYKTTYKVTGNQNNNGSWQN